MIQPTQSDFNFLFDVARSRREADMLHLWWLGQSGFLVHWQGHFLLIDPYLSDSLAESNRGTDRTGLRNTEQVIAPDRLDFIDVVTSSHDGLDHLDPDTLEPLFKVNPHLKLVIPEANRLAVSERLHIDPWLPLGLQDGTSVTVSGFRITGVPAALENLETDGAGRHRCLGYVVQAGPWTLYHCGDTVLYEGLIERLRQYPIDIAILPIGGSTPDRPGGSLDAPQAAMLAHEVGARVAIPSRYGVLIADAESPDVFVSECERLGQSYCVLRAGERWSSEFFAQ